MITINLSEEQAKTLLNSIGWRLCDNPKYHDNVTIESYIAGEIFTQLEQQLTPRSTSAAELAVFKHDAGYTESTVIEWKRKWGIK